MSSPAATEDEDKRQIKEKKMRKQTEEETTIKIRGLEKVHGPHRWHRWPDKPVSASD
jgi:hypothetical protein